MVWLNSEPKRRMNEFAQMNAFGYSTILFEVGFLLNFIVALRIYSNLIIILVDIFLETVFNYIVLLLVLLTKLELHCPVPNLTPYLYQLLNPCVL